MVNTAIGHVLALLSAVATAQVDRDEAAEKYRRTTVALSISVHGDAPESIESGAGSPSFGGAIFNPLAAAPPSIKKATPPVASVPAQPPNHGDVGLSSTVLALIGSAVAFASLLRSL